MSVKVGIPRALLYYYYYPLWKDFFESLGCEVVLSDKSNKGILDSGIKNTVDEACLPVKLAFGHVKNLADKPVDYIFIPRLVSVAYKEYICPKFLGFPDMARQNIVGLPAVIDTTISFMRKRHNVDQAYKQLGKKFSGNPIKVRQAYHKGLRALAKYNQLLLKGHLPEEAMSIMYDRSAKASQVKPCGDLNIAIIGHPYNIYDPYISMNIIKRLQSMGVVVVTPDHLSEDEVRHQAGRLPKKLFWTLGQRMIGAGYHYAESEDIDGIIHIAAFGCGPDSMTGELIERNIRGSTKLPFLNLTLDEHTGEAGVITRLEAFLDMVRWKNSPKKQFIS
ncbi:acyl-CoA dehydratase activase-related protein [Peptococcaceae bacterium 1198_IL3148]